MPRRRQTEVFSLSFLDCISCGFGAVVLLFVIINAQVAARAKMASAEVMSETSRIDEEVLEGRKNLVRLRNSLKEEQDRRALAAAEIARMQELIAQLTADLKEGDSLAQKESIEQLRADIRQLEESNKRLAFRNAPPEPTTGQRIRAFAGEGNRQYLTGIRMGGSHVLILVDGSGSMLGRNFVNVVRFRSMPDAEKRKAPKWRQAVRSVEWLLTQMQPAQQVQVVVFNEKPVRFFGEGSGWTSLREKDKVDRTLARLRQFVPGKGTSLINAFAEISELEPQPDNVFLITDGLPTQGDQPPPEVEEVQAQKRVKYMVDAIRSLPRKLPMNILLLPMDGDPEAAGYFWQMAYTSGGAMLTIAEDWP
ncbi:MAG: VWA domain-containing protein [Gammaproteobacteria bacterium]|nr:VWA domain-containing protein [Gammaproteobacteria bacterium]